MRFLSVALLVVVLSACSDGDRARNEARLCLDRIDAVDIHAPLDEREPRITALRELAITSEDVIATRDECLGAHQKLFEAERSLASARATLRQLERQATRSPAEVDALGATLESGNAAMEDAAARFELCERSRSALATRYGWSSR